MEATPYLEALRYVSNAKESLQKAGKNGGQYKDIKYVKAASGMAYSAVLFAIDEYLKRKEGIKFTKPKSIEEYRIRIGKQNKKMLDLLNIAYDSLHLAGYYHGTTSAAVISFGMESTNKIIEYIKEQ